MSNAKITLYGFARWMELNGKDLFSDLTLPSGIDKELFIDNVLIDAGEFGVLYADPDLMCKMIGVWGRKHYRTFDKWITALNKEYEPLYNLDVYDEWEEAGSTSGSKSGTSRGNVTDTLTGGYNRTDGYNRSENLAEDITDTNDLHNETSGTTITENTRSAFDSTSYQPHDMQEVSAESQSDDTGDVVRDRDQSITETNAGTQTDTHNESRTIANTGTTGEEASGTSSNEHSGHRYGNQGVTMSQQMLQAELDVQRWNIYEHMTDLFIQDFCIAVYI